MEDEKHRLNDFLGASAMAKLPDRKIWFEGLPRTQSASYGQYSYQETPDKEMLTRSYENAALRKYMVHYGNPPSVLKKLFDSNSEFRVSLFGAWA